MVTITFKNVGQGDSILLEWENNGKTKIGIIDCKHFDNKNPILEYLSLKSFSEIEFIVLSHFHIDHFSGFPDLFDYCNKKNITIKWFFHTIASQVLNIYNQIFTSKKVELGIRRFIESLESLDKRIIDEVPVNRFTAPIYFSDDLSLSFLAPNGKIYRDIAKQISRKVNRKIFINADINKLSTVISIQSPNNIFLLTSDAPKGCFRNLKGRIINQVTLTQAPHHGSYYNFHEEFWTKLSKIDNCPVVFTVGDEPKDKLPHKKTVEAFDNLGFDIYSTNNVYGIKEHLDQNTISSSSQPNHSKSNYLDHFSTKRPSRYSTSIIGTKFIGDQQFKF